MYNSCILYIIIIYKLHQQCSNSGNCCSIKFNAGGSGNCTNTGISCNVAYNV